MSSFGKNKQKMERHGKEKRARHTQGTPLENLHAGLHVVEGPHYVQVDVADCLFPTACEINQSLPADIIIRLSRSSPVISTSNISLISIVKAQTRHGLVYRN